MYTKSRVLDAQ